MRRMKGLNEIFAVHRMAKSLEKDVGEEADDVFRSLHGWRASYHGGRIIIVEGL